MEAIFRMAEKDSFGPFACYLHVMRVGVEHEVRMHLHAMNLMYHKHQRTNVKHGH